MPLPEEGRAPRREHCGATREYRMHATSRGSDCGARPPPRSRRPRNTRSLTFRPFERCQVFGRTTKTLMPSMSFLKKRRRSKRGKLPCRPAATFVLQLSLWPSCDRGGNSSFERVPDVQYGLRLEINMVRRDCILSLSTLLLECDSCPWQNQILAENAWC